MKYVHFCICTQISRLKVYTCNKTAKDLKLSKGLFKRTKFIQTHRPSREAFNGPTNSGNSISSSALNTSSALMVCLLDSLHMSFALHIDIIQKNVMTNAGTVFISSSPSSCKQVSSSRFVRLKYTIITHVKFKHKCNLHSIPINMGAGVLFTIFSFGEVELPFIHGSIRMSS